MERGGELDGGVDSRRGFQAANRSRRAGVRASPPSVAKDGFPPFLIVRGETMMVRRAETARARPIEPLHGAAP